MVSQSCGKLHHATGLALGRLTWDAQPVRWLRDRAAESLTAFRDVFRNPGLRRIELAYIGSEFARWEASVALAVLAYRSGGVTAVSLLLVVRMLPSALAAPFTSILGDRRNRVAVMLGADVLRVAGMGLLAVVAFTDAPIGAVYALGGLIEIVSTAFRPAQAALLPSLASTPQELTAANVVSSTIESVASFGGPAIGGVIVAVADPGSAFLVAAGAFSWSALLILLLRRSGRVAPRERSEETIFNMATAGFRAIATEPRVRLIVGLFSAQTLANGALSVLIVALALDVLAIGSAGLGSLDAVIGVGGLVGAFAAMTLVGRQRLAGAFGGGIVLWGAPIALIAAWDSRAGALVLLTLVGLANTIVDVAGFTLLQRAVPDEVLARVFGVLESLFLGTVALGGVIASALVNHASFNIAVVAAGGILPVLAVLSWRKLSAIDSTATVPVEQLALLRQISFFSLLPPTSLERLASRLIPVTVAAGETVIREGDPGDLFYIVASGRAIVTKDDTVLAEPGPGDFFGEIALLRDVPRTATVSARSDLELLALERDDFIAAVTGHAATADALGAVVAARLETLVRPAPRMI
jgi:MFS family permease